MLRGACKFNQFRSHKLIMLDSFFSVAQWLEDLPPTLFYHYVSVPLNNDVKHFNIHAGP